jgi:HK97 family phage prohead protease
LGLKSVKHWRAKMSQVKSWSILTVKSIDEESRIIKGIASTPSTDRTGDIVEPRGAKFKLPIPLLSQHDHDSPIGEVTSAQVTDKGIEIEAVLPKNSGLDYVEKAWLQIKSGLMRGLSVGFRALDAEPIKGGGVKFKSWEWIELSAVTVPANSQATILTVKNLDLQGSEVELETLKVEGDMARHDARIKAVAAIAKITLNLNK